MSAATPCRGCVPRRAKATSVSDEKIAVWAFVLQNMVTPPAVLYGSWAAAGLILAALGQPWVGLGFALVGMAFDAWAQARVRRYQKAEAPVAGPRC